MTKVGHEQMADLRSGAPRYGVRTHPALRDVQVVITSSQLPHTSQVETRCGTLGSLSIRVWNCERYPRPRRGAAGAGPARPRARGRRLRADIAAIPSPRDDHSG